MGNDATTLLWILGISLPIGLAIGIYLRVRHKPACERYAAYCWNLSWKWYALFGVMFTVHAVSNLFQSRLAFAAFGGVFAAAEYGFAIVQYFRSRKSVGSRSAVDNTI